MALCVFLLLLVVLESVYASPFADGQKKRDNDMFKRLGDIREKLKMAHDEGEYRRYMEELAMNDPEFARKINRGDIHRGPRDTDINPEDLAGKRRHPNINPEDIARGFRNPPNINPEDLARGPRDRNGARSKLEELQRLNIEEIKQLHRQQAAGNRPPIHGLGKDPPNMGSFRDGRVDQGELNRKLEEHRRVQAQIDEARREQFKRHEMQLEHLRRQKLKEMDEAQRLREEARMRQEKANGREHDRMVHPGSRKQLEDIWKNQDGLGDEKFDPRTFFYLHDVNGDNVLDPYEVESLFMNEVRKVYGDGSDDETMMREELSEMREHVMNEIDKNRDELVSLDEFLQYSDMRIFDIDEDWMPLKDKEVFTDEEIDRFEEHYDDYKYDYDEADEQQHDGQQEDGGQQEDDGEHEDGGQQQGDHGQQENGGQQKNGGQQQGDHGQQENGGQQKNGGQQQGDHGQQENGGQQKDGGQQQGDHGQQENGGQQKDGGQQENHEGVGQKEEPEANFGQL